MGGGAEGQRGGNLDVDLRDHTIAQHFDVDIIAHRIEFAERCLFGVVVRGRHHSNDEHSGEDSHALDPAPLDLAISQVFVDAHSERHDCADHEDDHGGVLEGSDEELEPGRGWGLGDEVASEVLLPLLGVRGEPGHDGRVSECAGGCVG